MPVAPSHPAACPRRAGHTGRLWVPPCSHSRGFPVSAPSLCPSLPGVFLASGREGLRGSRFSSRRSGCPGRCRREGGGERGLFLRRHVAPEVQIGSLRKDAFVEDRINYTLQFYSFLT